jgi:sulfite exporter TauE/SafE
MGGLLIIALGILVWFWRGRRACTGTSRPQEAASGLTLLLLGLSLGFSPCPPLIALLGEVMLISDTWTEGLLLGLSFGMGTFVSGFLVLGLSGSLIAWIPSRYFAPGGRGRLLYSAVASALLVAFGLWIVASSIR